MTIGDFKAVSKPETVPGVVAPEKDTLTYNEFMGKAEEPSPKTIATIPEEHKVGFTKYLSDTLQQMIYNGTSSVYKGIEYITRLSPLRMGAEIASPGINQTLQDTYINKPEEASAQMRNELLSKNKGLQFAQDTLVQLGSMGITLPVQMMYGGMAKSLLADNVLPAIQTALNKIPDFALGSGFEGWVKGVQEDGNVLQKAFKGTLGAGENIAINTLFAKAGGVEPEALAGKTAEEIAAITAKATAKGFVSVPMIGAANAYYEAAKEGRIASPEEVAKGAATGLVYQTFFTLIPHLRDASQDGIEKIALNGYQKEMDKAIKSRDLTQIQKVATDFLVDEKIRPEIRQAVTPMLNEALGRPIEEKILYHGTTEAEAKNLKEKGVTPGTKSVFGTSQEGFSLSTDSGEAKKYGEVITPYSLDPSAKIATPKDLPEVVFTTHADGEVTFNQADAVKAAKAKGFDGVDLNAFEQLTTEPGKSKEVQIFNPKVLKLSEGDSQSNESGQINLKNITESFKGTLGRVKQALSNLNQVFNPASKVISKLGEDAYSGVIKAVHTPEAESLGFDNAHSKALDKSFAQLEKDFNKLSPQEINDFNLTRGKAQSPEAQALQKAAGERLNENLKDKSLTDAIKEASDYVYKYAKDNDLSIGYFEDYFYGSYKNPNQVSKFLDYWRSTERYTKEKSLPTIADAQAFGLELKDPNPITNIKKEMLAVAQKVGLVKLREQQIADGHNYAVEAGDATPEQTKKWDKIEDPVFDGMLFDPEYAKFANSLLSTNKVNSNKITGAIKQAAFIGQQIKFMGSLFHLRNEVKAIVSDESWGLFNKEGYKNLAKSFKPIDQTSPEYKEYTNLGGGHRYSLESQAQVQMNKFLDTLGDGTLLEPVTNVLKSKWVPVSPAQIKWMFDEFIPALKFTKFQQESAAKAESLGRVLTDGEKIDIIKTGQNFYGEMNERLFGRSGTVTSALRLVFQAPGYGEGNFRALFASTKELGGGLVNLAKGEEWTKDGQRNARFVVSSLFSTLALATIGTYILTGKPPEKPETAKDVRDLFKMGTNISDDKGDQVFLDMMGYDNDFWTLYGNIATGQPGKVIPAMGKRVSGATSSVFRTLNDMTTIFNGGVVDNYFGKPIYKKTDGMLEKLGKFIAYEGTQAQPISVGSFGQFTRKGVSPALAAGLVVAGVRPSTSEQVKEERSASRGKNSKGNIFSPKRSSF